MTAPIFMLLLLATTTLSGAWLPTIIARTPSVSLRNSNNNSNDDDDDDDDEIPSAYRNRSLEWSNKYRNLIGYEDARRSVIDLGLRSKEEWDEYVAEGKRYHGPYLPSHPEEMYVHDWVSWDDFLGIRRDYNDSQQIVQTVLRLQSMEEYRNFVDDDPKRAEYLRIPSKPHIVYKDKGWISNDHFFGTMQ